MPHAHTHISLQALLLVTTMAVLPAAAQNSTAVEGDYYSIDTVPIPEGVVLEVGGLALMPEGDVAASTRRGEVWIIENPYGGSLPHYHRFARGLHEPLGLAYHDGEFYAAQRGELTRLRDVDHDWVADRYEAVATWPLEGNYHEYSYGPLFRPDGTMLVTLNLGWVGYGASLSRWRGWALEIDQDGNIHPYAAGMRSPAGMGFNGEGDLFFAENQGDWIGSGYITQIDRGDFAGHPASLRWSSDPDSPIHLSPEDIPDSGDPLFEVARNIPGFKPPAVWFPHGEMGISTSGILADTTNGRFGPFAGQLFVGDQGFSRINRVFLEQVEGVYQGAAFPFLEGFASGVLRMIWGRDGSMFVGMTSRGWDALGRRPYGLERVTWKGGVPFEVKEMRAMPDGFELVFTRAAGESASNPQSYKLGTYIYQYHHQYGSPEINPQDIGIERVVVTEGGMRARVYLDTMRQGYIHELHMPGVQSQEGEPLLHDTAYYTLNRIPSAPGSR